MYNQRVRAFPDGFRPSFPLYVETANSCGKLDVMCNVPAPTKRIQ